MRIKPSQLLPILLIISPGALCGSEFVNVDFRALAKERAKETSQSFKAKCRELGLSQVSCLKQLSDRFEEAKLAFTGPGSRTAFINVEGPQGDI